MRKIRKLFFSTFLISFSFFFINNTVCAEMIQWDLDCVISGGNCNSSDLYWGTIILDDTTFNGKSAVKITVDLVGDGIHKVLEVAMNFDDSLFNNFTDFKLVSGEMVEVDANNVKLQSYDGLDLEPSTGNGQNTFDPWSDILYLENTDLYSNNFMFTSGADGIYAAVHIGNYSAPGEPGDGSITVGSKGNQPIPEPATMLLLGAGLISLIGNRRKNKAIQTKQKVI